ncbi:MAG: DUF3828 domain-containing protein [Hyphomicrobium sp.]|jgi:hypothetical protein
MRRIAFMFALVIFAGTAFAETTGRPQDVITSLYEAYKSLPNGPDHKGIYSAKLQTLLDQDEKATPKGEVGRLDWDVFVDGNDWVIADLSIATLSEDAERGRVQARFKNHGEPREIVFDLVREDGKWVIDEIQSTLVGGRWTMTKVLMGAPDAFPDEPPAEGEAPAGFNAELPPQGEGTELPRREGLE